MRFKRGDIVLSAPGWTNGCFVITAVDPTRPKNAYNGMNLANRKNFRLSEASLGVKVGTATDEFLNTDPTQSTGNSITDVNFERGRRRAEYMTGWAFRPEDKARWGILAKATPNQWLDINLNGRGQRVQFKHVIEKGEKYVFSATNMNGTTYRYPLNVLVLPVGAVAKRDEAAILEDLRRVECQLSPENLTCDGELPRNQVMQRQRQLTTERRDLVRELGREPTTDELYPGLLSRV